MPVARCRFALNRRIERAGDAIKYVIATSVCLYDKIQTLNVNSGQHPKFAEHPSLAVAEFRLQVFPTLLGCLGPLLQEIRLHAGDLCRHGGTALPLWR